MLNNLTILDFETTGLNPEWDFVTEIGAVRVRDGIVTGQFQTFVNFGGQMPAEISRLTGITQADVDAGKDPVKAFRILRAFIGNSVIVAHNAAFDVAFLNRAYNRYGSEGLTLSNDWLCTKRLAEVIMPGVIAGYGLAALCEVFDIKQQGHHRALNDAFDTQQLYRCLENELFELSGCEEGSIEETNAKLEAQINIASTSRPHTSYYKWIPKGKEATND